MAGCRPGRQCALAGLHAKPVEMPGPQTGFADVEPAAFVQRHQHVVIELARIGIWRRPVAVAEVQDAPRPGAGEVLARHASEGLNHALIAEMADYAKILGEPAPRLVEAGHSVNHRQSFRTCIWIGPSARP